MKKLVITNITWDSGLRAKPAIIEADETFALPTPTSSEVLGQKFVLSTPQPIKRLGWSLSKDAVLAKHPCTRYSPVAI